MQVKKSKSTNKGSSGCNRTSFVRVVWTGTSNLRRTKMVPYELFTEELQADGIGLTPAIFACPATMDVPAPGAGVDPTGELRLVPDMSTLRTLPYHPNHQMVLADMFTEAQTKWPCCPRLFLKAQIARAQAMGYSLRAGFENEFVLFKSCKEEPFQPVDDTIYAMTQGIHTNGHMLDAVVAALAAQDVRVLLMHPESAQGQYEMALQHQEPLQAADQQIVFKETLAAVAAQHGLRVCNLPKVNAMQAGNAMHVHLSLWKGGQNLFSGDKGKLDAALRKGKDAMNADLLPKQAQQFVAGLLHHFPALVAVLSASNNSYRRLQPGCWAGAYQCWGFNNREAGLRVPSHPRAGLTNVEVKPLDHTANPYLALGCLIAAGLDGLENRRELPPPVQVNPGTPENKGLGVPRLPDSLRAALQCLEGDEVLCRAMGGPLLQMYLATKRFELSQTESLSLEEEVAQLKERF
eukprot:g27358.t1